MLPITYSPAYTLVPTYECFNRCSYCNFRQDPGQDKWLTESVAKQRLEGLAEQGVREILILAGEVHPQSSLRKAWFELLYNLAKIALDLGFYPHTNAGPLNRQEMASLKEVNFSLGLMLEQVSPRLFTTVHRHAPSKEPQLRLKQLQLAGELAIPFTTGLLLGIGETDQEVEDSLMAIANIQQQYGHIQEVILQPHSPGKKQTDDIPIYSPQKLVQVVALAKEILPQGITLQIPPNLVGNFSDLLACLAAGVRDLGGIVPIDEVNPNYHHQSVNQLSQLLEENGYLLQPRLPVYPTYFTWLIPPLQDRLADYTMGNLLSYPIGGIPEFS
ncbi:MULTISPECIES: 7,8-didemethyl-8-hydroxy-5-deazariboflavin synthase subunit CofG [unclassified Synechocystis]|uniref:7,8-didemethyl-8-hydroxy-5-deazariboflavin synthase subunit CofG n=1 Tax=unclassified Synechocystis TaxID=2640012 RepID=UPI0004D127BD|nr:MULTISPECIES: 7,8-didemethyl-8-hydroxy-5-deazariboflavin synthase subunit CofG [unclassified Synechocystis]AIE73332.1 7,8-didemethyl-8-hydroxy-5-deazariboflavin synthase subunit 1 [Synechocystis sp. PCC 6714]MCT0253151.1 7,8-didemethyl-8-hydroxy-5-deazariboflavin synthase subunit CofG [Synechocystis sp. CS-94]